MQLLQSWVSLNCCSYFPNQQLPQNFHSFLQLVALKDAVVLSFSAARNEFIKALRYQGDVPQDFSTVQQPVFGLSALPSMLNLSPVR